MNNKWIKYGALMAAMAMVLGAFEPSLLTMLPHNTSSNSSPADVEVLLIVKLDVGFANQIQMLHAIALIAIGLVMLVRTNFMLTASAWAMLLGTVGYVGSAYAFVFFGASWVQWIAVASLVGLIAGWLALVEGACPGFKSQPGPIAAKE